MNPTNSWSIEYSYTRDSYHVGRTVDMLQRNIQAVQADIKTDYICVGLFATRDLAMDAMLDFRRKRVPGQTFALL